MKKNNKKRKKIKRKIIKKIRIIFFLAIIALIAFFIVYMNFETNEPSEAMNVLNEYMSYISDEKYEEMYNLLSDNSKAKVTKEDFIEKNETVYTSLEANNVKISDMSEEEENRESENHIHNRNEYCSWNFKICKYCKA